MKFASLVKIVLASGFTEKEICDGLKISRPTLKRWASGKPPRPCIQKAMFRWLRKQIM